jgi:hypothetical protein
MEEGEVSFEFTFLMETYLPSGKLGYRIPPIYHDGNIFTYICLILNEFF